MKRSIDDEIENLIATDSAWNEVLDRDLINLPDPPERPPVDYSKFTLAELLDDLVSIAQGYGFSEGFDKTESDVEAARARVDARLKQAGLL